MRSSSLNNDQQNKNKLKTNKKMLKSHLQGDNNGKSAANGKLLIWKNE